METRVDHDSQQNRVNWGIYLRRDYRNDKAVIVVKVERVIPESLAMGPTW